MQMIFYQNQNVDTVDIKNKNVSYLSKFSLLGTNTSCLN